ncbi:MAG: hypothetical protein S4CHLAM45_02670 [Chlamydiales bacterium]|nr:hypothetical protein [Chlamydiales bacterium]MCH9619125.1 hypothetical protein [Chlamydiales bacterium]MCH9622387.1 hypothetical protein [Chlamydiales bacterium]
MKKIYPFLLIFLLFPFFIKKDRVEHFEIKRPTLPSPQFSHPWIAKQKVGAYLPEMERDIELLEAFCDKRGEDITPLLITMLTALQAEIPFLFPENLYNVLCITDVQNRCPFDYRVYKRLYLGDTDLNMPMYLDVRVFDVKKEDVSAVIQWHATLLNGAVERLGEGVLVKGGYTEIDYSHGFAPQRALFLLPHYQEGKLYLLYSDVPLEHCEGLCSIVNSFSFLQSAHA